MASHRPDVRSRSFAVAGSVLLGALLGACGGNGGLSTGADMGSTADLAITTEQACSDTAAAYCAKVQSCAPIFLQIVYGDLATCTARLKLACAPSLAAPGTSQTAARIDACAAALGSASCDSVFGGKICGTMPGTLANGAACVDSNQCMSAYCNRGNGGCGACSAQPALGAACDGDCGTSGYQCDSKVCVSYVPLHGPCDGQLHKCTPGLYCSKQSQSCEAPLPAGAACTPNADPPCNLLDGHFCHPINKVCAEIKYAAAGQSCGYVMPDFYLCSGSSTCQGAQGAQSGTCLAPAADGAACDAQKGPACLPPALCSNGLCRIFDPSACH